MWTPEGSNIVSDDLGDLKPFEVLIELGCEPLSYVAKDKYDGLILIHSLAVENEVSRYLIVPTDSRILDEMKAGRMDLLTGLRQPRCWIVDLVASDDDELGFRVQLAVQVRFESIPEHYLPWPGAMIRPELESLFRIRLIGDGVGPGKTTAADVRTATGGTESLLKTLATLALGQDVTTGRTSQEVRSYSSLPLQYTRAASFEVAFGRPEQDSGQIDPKILNKMGQLFADGLASIRNEKDTAGEIAGLDFDKSRSLIKAIREITPPSTGGIETIEVSGSLATQNPTPIMLTRKDRNRLDEKIRSWKRGDHRNDLIALTGFIEEADRGNFTFTLRRIEPSGRIGTQEFHEVHFRFEDSFEPEVLDSFSKDLKVVVFGESYKLNHYDLLGINLINKASEGATENES